MPDTDTAAEMKAFWRDSVAALTMLLEADPEIMRFGGGVPPMFYFRDPDGNRLLIVERA